MERYQVHQILLGLYCILQLTSIVLFEVALALVTDVVPQVYLHDKNNFAVSTLICAQLTTGKFMAVYQMCFASCMQTR